FDLHHRQFLAVADAFVITFAAAHFERELFLAAFVLDHVGHHARTAYRGRADRDLAVAVHQQHAVKRDRLAGLNGQALDFHRVARGHTILFASGFQYG